ncbi:hypothetical protein LEP1GSC090_0635 [Leptospira borgpetersenii serovar Javanica str. MK146]|nr:hypothetical protein LEP1GSC055_3382 [Leptospira borgpetersenii str. Brem 307]EMN57751.1 hypothetical protein LEP1GSC090_0635 [Leptospira borgpetersenii serovar Javanica str. MK146]
MYRFIFIPEMDFDFPYSTFLYENDLQTFYFNFFWLKISFFFSLKNSSIPIRVSLTQKEISP